MTDESKDKSLANYVLLMILNNRLLRAEIITQKEHDRLEGEIRHEYKA